MGCFPIEKPKDPNTGQVMTLTTVQTEESEPTNAANYTGPKKVFLDKINMAKDRINAMAKKGQLITDKALEAILIDTIGLEQHPLINEMMLKIHTSKPDQPEKEQRIIAYYTEKLDEDQKFYTIEMLKLSKTLSDARQDKVNYAREIYYLNLLRNLNTSKKDDKTPMSHEDSRQDIKVQLAKRASIREKDLDVKQEVKKEMKTSVFSEIEKKAQEREKDKEVKTEVKSNMQEKVFAEIERRASLRQLEKEVKTEVKTNMQDKVFSEIEKKAQEREKTLEIKAEVKTNMQDKVFTEIEKKAQEKRLILDDQNKTRKSLLDVLQKLPSKQVETNENSA